MGASLNEVRLIGNLGADPETNYTGSGTQVCNLRIATTETWKDKAGAKQERTEWHRVVFFGKLAEIAAEYLSKGDMIHVEGSIRTESYEKDNVTHYATKIMGSKMLMLRTKGAGEASSQGGQKAKRTESVPSNTFEDDDIPF